jgi:hypothetical protein
MNDTRKPNYLAVARLGSVRGLEGELRLVSYSGEFSHIARAGEILVGGPLGLEDARPMKILHVLQGGWEPASFLRAMGRPKKRASSRVGKSFCRANRLAPKNRVNIMLPIWWA